jgi:hypothetical protein
MFDRKNDVPRRPVDALFGESSAANSPTYVVEPPQPVTTTPPPISDEFPEPVAPTSPKFEPMASTEPEPVHEESEMMPPLAPRGEEPTFTPSVNELPALPMTDALPFANEPLPEPVSEESMPIFSSRSEERLAADLSFRIERLYDDIKMDLPDSPSVTRECMEVLRDARDAHMKRDYATAEFLAQMVDARLKRSVKSLRASKSPVLIAMWAWQLVMLLAFGGLLAITFVMNLTLFGLPVANEFIVFLRALGWGGIGGVFGASLTLLSFLQSRDYDPAFDLNYALRPLFGAVIGAMMFAIAAAFSFSGIVVSPAGKPGDMAAGAVVLYVVALFAGYRQDYVVEFFDGLLRALLRKPQTPRGK